MIAVVRVRGIARLSPDIRKAFELLKLDRPNSCILLEETPQNLGTIRKIKDYVTWGKVNDDVLKSLKEKGKIANLNPPKKGYGRKGIKIPFKIGGALGDRGEKINDLILRML